MSDPPVVKDNYKYARIGEDEIRLLELYPGAWDTELCGRLCTYKLVIEHDDSNAGFEIDDDAVAPSYDAVSYLWGDKPPGTSMRLYSPKGEDMFLPIKPNLEEALRRFRSKVKPNNPLRLWIDAICINQKHPTEQSAQIRKMADIYAQAEKVRIWLGKETEDSPAAIKFIQRLLTFDQFDELSTDPMSAEEWNALRNLMQRNWFKRRWIIQEIAYSREAVVFCGRDELPWEDLARAVSLFALKREDLRELFQKAAQYAHSPDYLGEIEGIGAKTLVETLDIVLRKSEDGEVLEHLLSLETLVSTLTAFEATFPHDYIYAILWLCKDAMPGSQLSRSYDQHQHRKNTGARPMADSPRDGRRWAADELRESPAPASPRQDALGAGEPRGRSLLRPPQHAGPRQRSPSPMVARLKAEREANIEPRETIYVDYEKSMYGLCKEFVELATRKSNSLDIICRPWAPPFTGHKSESHVATEDKLPMPSWLSPLSKRPYGIRPQTGDRVYSRVAADTLVGTSITGLKNYNACGAFGVRYKEPHLIQSRKLKARGFVVESIETLGSEALNAVIPAEWLRLGLVDWEEQLGAPPENFWRTLVANRVSSRGPQLPPSYWANACKWAFERRVQHETGHLNPSDLLMNVSGKCQSVIIDFLQRVRSVVWNRRLFETKATFWNPMLGLAPSSARKGDLICILYGCSVPVLLRKKTKSMDNISGQKRRPNDDEHSSSPATKRRRKSTLPPVRQSSKASFTETAVGIGSGAQGSPTANNAEGMTAEINALAAETESSNSTIWDSARLHNERQEEPRSEATGKLDEDYVLIGECYVHGLMDGEAFRIKKHGHILDQDFHIV